MRFEFPNSKIDLMRRFNESMIDWTYKLIYNEISGVENYISDKKAFMNGFEECCKNPLIDMVCADL